MVVREAEGVRVQSMVWGFPRPMKSKKTGLPIKPKPVNNIAEAEGKKGSMTRTWFAVKNRPASAWAGMWRISDEWGAVYSGMMTDCNEAIRPVHDRMPVLLHVDE